MDSHRRFGPNIAEIERHHRLPATQFFEQFVLTAKPVILTGLTDDWPARTRWTLEFFRDSFGDRTAKVTAPGNGYVEMTIGEYLRFLADPNDKRRLYLASWTIHPANGNVCLVRDYNVPAHFQPCWQWRIPRFDPHWEWIFVAKEGMRLGLHVDIGGSSAWNAVITGKKEVIAYPYDEFEKLRLRSSPYSVVDAFEPDETLFPDFRRAHGVYGELHPGDLIYLPSRWIHQFNNVESGISVTHNWINHANWRYYDDWIAQTKNMRPISKFVRRSILRLFAGSSRIGSLRRAYLITG